MQLNRLLILVIALAVIACCGCLTDTEQNNVQETAPQNSTPLITFGSGFQNPEDWSGTLTRWIQANATLLVESSENRNASLSMNAQSFYRNRTLEVYAANELVTKMAIPTKGFAEIEAPIHLLKGINTLMFRIPEGCERPSDKSELNSSDGRCLSVAVQNVALAERKSCSLEYLSGFYDTENWAGVPSCWMQANATLLVNSSENRTATLSLNAQSFYRNRTLEISSGGVIVGQVNLPTSFIDVSVPLQLAKGANVVQLRVPEGCERPNDIKELNNPDERCLSVAVKNITLDGE